MLKQLSPFFARFFKLSLLTGVFFLCQKKTAFTTPPIKSRNQAQFQLMIAVIDLFYRLHQIYSSGLSLDKLLVNSVKQSSSNRQSANQFVFSTRTAVLLALSGIQEDIDKGDVAIPACQLAAFYTVDHVITCKRGSAAVVRTTCCSYGEPQILNLFRAETTVPINTTFSTIDYLGEITTIAKFGYDRFKGSVSPGG